MSEHLDLLLDLEAALIDAGEGVFETIVEDCTKALVDGDRADFARLTDEAGRVYHPDASLDYLKALWCFVNGERLNGQVLRIPISERVAGSLQGSLIKSLTSGHFASRLIERSDLNDGQKSRRKARSSTLDSHAGFLLREALRAERLPGGNIAMPTSLAGLTSYLQSAAGKTQVTALSSTAKLVGGQSLIVKAAEVAAVRLEQSPAMMSFANDASAIVGAHALTETILSTLFRAKAQWVNVLRVGNGQIQPTMQAAPWVALSVFLTHAQSTFPDRLARQIPEKIGFELMKAWPQLSKHYAKILLVEMIRINPKDLLA